jgi:HTH-type transcriptional regulator / antitoxin HigA
MNKTIADNKQAVSLVYNSLADFAPDWLVAPGDTIADLLEERGWTQAELAKRTGFTAKHINQLLKGDAPITQETAAKLEKVLGSTVRFWVGLDTQYREQLARRAELSILSKDVGWLKVLPLADMIRFGWVTKLSDKALQVRECLKFFAVSDVLAWRATYSSPVAAYRASPKLIKLGPSVAAWLRQGERVASSLRCGDYDKGAFEAALKDVRELTRQPAPAKFLPELQKLCAAAGVVVVIEPAPNGCPVSGATKWLAPSKALIMLSVRGKSDDKLWFTFFHEAAHLLKHGKSLTFLDILGDAGLNANEEAEADAFARDFLISSSAWATFVQNGAFGKTSIQSFAKANGISSGIVVGRLQFDQHIPYANLNALKVKYEWTHEPESA